MKASIYIGYHFDITPSNPGVEILIAELGYAGFESFVEHSNGVTAYIQKEEYYPSILDDIQILNNNAFTINYTSEEIEQVNWNAKWEELKEKREQARLAKKQKRKQKKIKSNTYTTK